MSAAFNSITVLLLVLISVPTQALRKLGTHEVWFWNYVHDFAARFILTAENDETRTSEVLDLEWESPNNFT